MNDATYRLTIYELSFDVFQEGPKWHVAAADLRTDEECKSGIIPAEHLYRMELAGTAVILGGDEGFSTRQAAIDALELSVDGRGSLPYTSTKLRIGSLKDGEMFWFRGREYQRCFALDGRHIGHDSSEHGLSPDASPDQTGAHRQGCAFWYHPDTLVTPRGEDATW